MNEIWWPDAADFVISITGSGCCSFGWVQRLPSGDTCFVDVAVWYRGDH